ncbi:MAG: hypothetical protein Hals2KO_12370 [Halioglobus sp.]
MAHAAYNPCIVIPVFNHPEGIAWVCERLAAFALPVILIDDGSDDHCRQVLAALDSEHDWISLRRFNENRGKGAAVCAALLWAQQLGFSHALQVDADGQHDLQDVPRFLAASRAHPEAVVTGDRVAEGISATRHYGRKLTDWLVWLETLSFCISDSMCGYRIYPLQCTAALLQTRRVGQRMDFDTDILVRLYWRGLQVVQVKTRVIYREGIPSHFRMLWDNLYMIRMHLRLLFGMLPRAPLLLTRKFTH